MSVREVELTFEDCKLAGTEGGIESCGVVVCAVTGEEGADVFPAASKAVMV